MPIRIKLLLLFLCLALPPVLIIGFLSLASIGDMGQSIIDYGRQSLIERDRAYLEDKVSDIGALLRKQVNLAEHSLRIQASAVEKALAGAPPPNKLVYLAEDFDRGAITTTRLPHYERQDGAGILPVSLDHTVFLITGSDTRSILEQDIQRLNSVTATYRSLYENQVLTTLWQYTSLENGLHSSYPGHGGYPEGYDPRRRPWYREAIAAGKLTWTRTTIDATTGRLIITGATPVRRPDGQIAGVTALDLAIDDLFRSDTSDLKHWLQDAQMMVLVVRAANQLEVFAKRHYQSQTTPWNEALATEYFADPDNRYYNTIVDLNLENPVALYEADYEQEPALWAVTPIQPEVSYLAVVFPVDQLAASANQAAQFIQKQQQAQLTTTVIILLAITLMIVFIAFLTAHRVTDPLKAIATTAKAIAGGKLESRTDIHRKDEIGALASDINAMAQAIEKLQREQESALMQMIRSLTRALEKKDSYTAAHSGRVARYAVRLGKRIGLDEETLEMLRHGALTHDLGKIGIPDSILNKPSPLNDDEAEIMSQHPEHTAKIMRPLVRFNAFAQIAAWHHERWDGTGYPDGLQGESIPLLARIVAIADTWDAMTGDRVYRQGMSVEKALSILEKERESGQWDPQLVHEFIAMIREETGVEQHLKPLEMG